MSEKRLINPIKGLENLTEDDILNLIHQDGIKRCLICGDTLDNCDKRADELGFDECEWLAEK